MKRVSGGSDSVYQGNQSGFVVLLCMCASGKTSSPRLPYFLLAAIFLLLLHPCLGQNARTYEAYFIKNGKEILVDSFVKDTALRVFIDFPLHKTDSAFSGQGTVRYIRTTVHDTCSFAVQINATTDSLSFNSGAEYFYDACRGHSDAADIIWMIFSQPVCSKYVRRQDHLIFIQDNEKIIALRPY